MSKFVFFLGGPRAYVSRYYWTSKYNVGCNVARIVGVRIPDSTYENALIKVSQHRRCNHTAILPLEV